MASLYIAEYDGYLVNGVQVPREPPLAEQKITISGVSAASAAFNTQTKLVRLHTDAICSVLFGETPVATAAKQRLPADATEFKSTQAGHKVAVISNT